MRSAVLCTGKPFQVTCPNPFSSSLRAFWLRAFVYCSIRRMLEVWRHSRCLDSLRRRVSQVEAIGLTSEGLLRAVNAIPSTGRGRASPKLPIFASRNRSRGQGVCNGQTAPQPVGARSWLRSKLVRGNAGSSFQAYRNECILSVAASLPSPWQLHEPPVP